MQRIIFWPKQRFTNDTFPRRNTILRGLQGAQVRPNRLPKLEWQYQLAHFDPHVDQVTDIM